jgi:hypothetical protein
MDEAAGAFDEAAGRADEHRAELEVGPQREIRQLKHYDAPAKCPIRR